MNNLIIHAMKDVGRPKQYATKGQVEMRWNFRHTFHLSLIGLWLPHHQCCCFAIQRIGRIGIAEELRQEDLKDVDHVVHGRPGLVDDVQTDRTRAEIDLSARETGAAPQQSNSQLINVGVEDAVDKANAWALVRILVREFDVNFPMTASEGSCTS